MSIDSHQIAEKIKKKGVDKSCHRCGGHSFTVLDGVTLLQLQDDCDSGLIIGGPSIPVVHTICDKCGAIVSHAAGVLDLLSKRGHK
jgi:ribosomal protein L37E